MPGAPPVFSIRFTAMASPCEICLAAGDKARARLMARQAIDEVTRIECKYSRYRQDSVVGRINAAAGKEWVDLDEESLALFTYADELFRASDGLFDITSGVLRRAWNFRVPELPAPEVLQSILPLIGWQMLDWRASAPLRRIRLPRAGMEIDLGGFGKEYAVDRAAAILAMQGVRHGYVNLGGDMRAVGPRPDGSAWSIGIQSPRNAGETIASISLESGALATSGDYERFFECNGRRYCHILDPRTGQPVEGLRSVSVLAPLVTVAGSHSTIAMLKGDAGLSFLHESGLAFLAIDQSGNVHLRHQPRGGKVIPTHDMRHFD
ncbi:FAD:protein FMN transferase [Noviherbaspirillum galbum]|uniref:FAD:protein FMN transferase n=1 Tax=Noviherbaspirillum galbum TaxID=2709383 RepID=A0A6B3SUP5_9BURK|nr:FAD:protein FMN transferase [Noviherbaspirillum galbum]NEX64750.1 FAD:protein FMN transferase [Noviherbaspirillum galbum]